MKEHNGTTHTFSKHFTKFLTYNSYAMQVLLMVILSNAHLWHSVKMCGVLVGPENGDLCCIIFSIPLPMNVNP